MKLDFYVNKIRDVLICIAVIYGSYTVNNILYKIDKVSNDLSKTKEELTSIKEYLISPEFDNDLNKVKATADTLVNKVQDIRENFSLKR